VFFMTISDLLLHQSSLSLNHQALINLLAEKENILIIQDLDGVCMGLVKDPLTRFIDKKYIEATKSFADHFYVLTNGEHIGKRGVNGIVERAFGNVDFVQQNGFYLPGLAGGGVQWQDCYGNVSHPGVSEAELAFLEEVPKYIESHLQQLFQDNFYGIEINQIKTYIQAAVLDNKVSPTANLNVFYELLNHQEEKYIHLQQEMQNLLKTLLEKAKQKGLGDSFFIHYAPNLGKDIQGQEIIQLAQEKDSGTTDFQFMLRGAIKEAGVLVILNHYYYQRTGNHPLGENFNSRKAPREKQELLNLIKDHFDPVYMPTIIGVGDTVTSKPIENCGQIQFGRGGSDRGFLELIQAIGQEFNTGNIIVYVDSSQGEVKNRKPLKLDTINGVLKVVKSPGDSRDQDDPLTLNVVFPGGHEEYINCFQEAAKRRGERGSSRRQGRQVMSNE
jgi:glucosylglycerol 3-phosphatase